MMFMLLFGEMYHVFFIRKAL